MLVYHSTSMDYGTVRSKHGPLHNNNNNLQSQNELDLLEVSKSQRCLRRTTQFLFSHIGLVGLVVIYAVAGAFLFQLLEQREERFLCLEAEGEQEVEVTKLKQILVSYIQSNTTTSVNYLREGKDNTTVALDKIGAMLYDYRDFVINATIKYQFVNEDCTNSLQWTYANALLFAITVITTIGYGNLTPKTWEGQLCCICYATIGIPIFLLCLANISGVLGEMFRFLYAKVLCAPCAFVRKRRELANKAKHQEENEVGKEQIDMNNYSMDDKKKRVSIKRPSDVSMDRNGLDNYRRRYPRIAVPLTVTMVIIAGYLWLGSILFHNFEGWTMMQSGYFCFITLATIGFGDFVPGQRRSDPNASAKLLLGSIYVLFGMAILAMCFDLMQEEIVAKFRWVGTKIGIIDKDDEPRYSVDRIPPMKQKGYSLGALSLNDPMTNRSRSATETENDLSVPNNSNVGRKSSPRNNSARVHPLDFHEPTLHQRPSSTKSN